MILIATVEGALKQLFSQNFNKMKKLNVSKKLSLNKETITSLDKNQMMDVKGGFTYSLSTGWRCQKSQKMGDCYKENCQAM
ncbi:MAG: class I lanthipeptide [Cyclobacteriaceae bacterium]|jgi:natural product precursor